MSSLQQPYPFQTLSEALRRNLYFSVFVTVFLLIFKPFGLNVYAYERAYVIGGYGVVIFLCASLNDWLAYRLFPNIFSEKNWKVINQLCWMICQLFFIGIGCFLYAIAINAFPAGIISFLKIELYVWLCSIIPLILIVLFRQNYLLRQNLKQAGVFDQQINVHPTPSQLLSGTTLELTGDNQNEKLVLDPDQLYYICAQENYFEVAWSEKGKLSRKLLRGTLSKAEASCAAYPFLLRSHRAYIVNLKKVKSVSGNAQGYRLQLDGLEEIVPVSRSRGPALHQALSVLK